MTSRDRLHAALEKLPVDRIPVNLYEVGGFRVDPDDQDPFNVRTSPSWRSLLKLAVEKSDLIWMRAPQTIARSASYDRLVSTRTWEDGESRFTETNMRIGKAVLTQLERRDMDVETNWTVSHFASEPGQLKTLLELPDDFFVQQVTVANLVKDESELGDRGVVMVDTPDPLCIAAALFEFGAYTVAALTMKDEFHALLRKIQSGLLSRTKYVARSFPGRLWRIYGPEYATPPYLPPGLFREYVNPYTGEMVKAIQEHGGKVRLHAHGKVRSVLQHVVAMGVDAVDPVEPPPQGDLDLSEAIAEYGDKLTFFGNIEVSDIENLPPEQFRELVQRTMADASGAPGFVLMPTASPYGRVVPDRTLENYRILMEEAQGNR